MIKKFIDKLLGKTSTDKPAIPKGKRVEVPLSEHNIDLKLVDDNAIRVVKTLADAGYEAYIVGGAVRDLLVGLRPKDFDVATNATPEQVKALFRRAFIIGRRFRIVHVVYGRGREHEVIEVSTFRAVMDSATADQVAGNEKTSKSELAGKTHVVDAAGRVLRDNVWGPQIEDAARRDFTVNAMYYDPQRQIVVDYHGGIKDAKKKVLRMIGDPATRYREDPVRIIRVIRFAAKLGFSIDPKTRAPIQEMASLLESVPASRTFDEMIKLLQTGHALSSIEELRKQGLVGARTGVFPILDVVLDDANKHPERAKFVQLALADTDRRVGEGKPVAPSFMLACMLWHDVLDRWHKLKKRGEPPFQALQLAVDAVFDARIGDISGRGKLASDMREIWLMQPRFERRTGQGPLTLVEQLRFRAGFDFLRLRAEAGEIDAELSEWWEAFSVADEHRRANMLDQARSHDAQRRRAPAAGHAAEPAEAPEEAASSSDAPRKRRRRRRKPGGADAAGASSSDPQ
ncbi:MAG: polynucleotide adenylyltransferase PcnB [Rhizobacter sp.]|nr:polynucleotide adenylyltransferase PcnB [Rhizobacter sp.]